MSAEPVPISDYSSKRPRLTPWVLKCILGMILQDEVYRETYFPILTADHFKSDDDILQIWAEAIWKYYDTFKEFPTIDALLEEVIVQRGRNIKLFTSRPTDEQLSVMGDYLAQLLDPAILDQRAYIESVTTSALRFNAVYQVVTSYRQGFISGNLDVEEFTSDLIEASVIATPTDVGITVYDSLPARTAKRLEDGFTPGLVHFGIPELEVCLEDGGLTPGSLAYWMAMPGGGKTSSLVQCSKEAALIDGHNVLFVTLEMTRDQILKKFDCCFTGANGRFVRRDAEAIYNTVRGDKLIAEAMSRIRVVELPMGGGTVEQIDAILVRLERQGWKVGMVAVDYADHLRSSRRFTQRWEEVEAVWSQLKGLAVKHKLVVWTATQMTDEGVKAAESGKEGVSLRHADKSKSKQQLVSLAIGIAATMEERKAGRARCIILKIRDGEGVGKTVLVYPDFGSSRLFTTGQTQELASVDVEKPIAGLDPNAVADELLTD